MLRNDVYWMEEALKEGEKARFIAAPNPSVGCVLVKDGVEIARGHTQAPGSNHAEIEAIEAAYRAGITPVGATAYVTLEPCSHQGRTPPCAKRLVKEGISRVVYAVEDPNPLVKGAGARILREAGIDVLSGVCEEEARIAHAGFFSRIQRGRPWVRLKSAISLDGRTALTNGVSQWITSEAAREDGHKFRARAQALLTGIGTVLADDPEMNVRLAGKWPTPVKFVLDPEAKTPPTAKILRGAKTTLFVSASVEKERTEPLEKAGAEIFRLKTDAAGHFSLMEVLEEIGRRDVNELHLEAGANLSGEFLKAGLVDELLLYVAPILLGDGMPLAKLPMRESLEGITHWKFVSAKHIGRDVRFTLFKD